MVSWIDVSDTTPRIAYTATASQTLFTVPFVFFEDADLLVYQNDVLLTLGTHYTVAGEEDEDGGTVTLLTGATAGDAISIVRSLSIVQTTHIPPSGPLDIPAINIQFSKLIAIDQQLADSQTRTVHLGQSDPTADMEVPSVTDRKGKMWAWHSADGSLVPTTHTSEEFDSIVTGALTTAGGFGDVNIIGTLAGLKALTPIAGAIVYVQGRAADGDGGQGIFAWKTGDYSTQIAIDTNEGIYVKATSTAATVGAWLRQFDRVHYQSLWFGTVADHTTDNTAIISTIVSTADILNTLTTPGKQGAAIIDIEGGVRFASTGLSFLPLADDVFVYLRYYANSDTTKGVPSGGGATNEQMLLSVNSGYPGDATGAMVAEQNFSAPLHPAIVLNIAKQVDGADAHFPATQIRIPTSTNPVRASYNLRDENVQRFRMIYEGYGDNNVATGVYLQPFLLTVDLNNVGSTGWPTIPAAGTVITGVTSGAIGIKVSHNTTDCFVKWVAGQFLPGEKITDGVTTSTNNIGGGGVTYAETTNAFFGMGINNPVATYGVPPGYAVTGLDIGARLTLRKSTGSVGGANHKETVTNAGMLFTNTAAAVPTTGRQIQLDGSNRLVSSSGVANGTGSTAHALINSVGAHCFFPHGGGVNANAFNVATAVPTGTGTYTMTFTNALVNANYSVVITRTNPGDFPIYVDGSKTTAGFNLANYDSSGNLANLVGKMDVVVIGGT
jgi:hypothetical protein